MRPMKPSIYDYSSYRDYLRDSFEYFKTIIPNFSHRLFASRAGLRTSNILLLSIKGKRNLAPATVEKFSKALGLNRDEGYYFKNLVLLNQCRTTEEKQIYARELVKCHGFKHRHPLGEKQYRYFSSWYYPVIREMIALPHFREEAEWISHHLGGDVSPKKVTEAISVLMELGLVRRDAGGKLVQVGHAVITPDEVTSHFVAQIHRELLTKGIEAIELYKRGEREISGITFRVSMSSLPALKDVVQRFRKEVESIIEGDTQADAIYQLHTLLFPLAVIPHVGETDPQRQKKDQNAQEPEVKAEPVQKEKEGTGDAA